MDDVSALAPTDHGLDPQQQGRGRTYGDINVYGTAHLGDRCQVQLPSHVSIVDHRHQFLESLRFPEMNARLNTISESHSQTFEWLFAEYTGNRWDCFTDWLKSGQEIYLIEGKAGSGKSTLMKFICNHERTTTFLSRLDTTPPLVLRHFLWLAGSLLQRSYRGLLACLLFQLVECSSVADINFVLETNEHRSKRSLADWSDVALESCLLGALQAVPRLTLVFIDGLDEFDQAERPIRLVKFIHKLKCVNNVKICVSSRPTLWLPQLSSIAKTLRLQDLTVWDIKRFAGDVLQAEFDFYCADLTKTEIYEIVEVITQQAEGVFLWVKYALHSLSEGFGGMDDVSSLKERLLELPKGMQGLYEHIWRRHENWNTNHRVEAAIFFNCADLFERLTTLELAVMTDESLWQHYRDKAAPFPHDLLESKLSQIEGKLVVRTGGLLELGPTPTHVTERTPSAGPSIVFMHRTVRDFLFGTEYGRSIAALPDQHVADLCQRRLCAPLVALVQDSAPPEHWDASSVCQLIEEFEIRERPVHLETLCWIDRTFETLTRRSRDYPASLPWFYELSTSQDRDADDLASLLVEQGAFKSARMFIKDRMLCSRSLGRYLACSLLSVWVPASAGTASDCMQFGRWLIDRGADLLGKQLIFFSFRFRSEIREQIRLVECTPPGLFFWMVLRSLRWRVALTTQLVEGLMPPVIDAISESTVVPVCMWPWESVWSSRALGMVSTDGRFFYTMNVHIGKLYPILQEATYSSKRTNHYYHQTELRDRISTAVADRRISAAVTDIDNVLVRVGKYDSWEALEPNEEVRDLILKGLQYDSEATRRDYYDDLALQVEAVSVTYQQGDLFEMLEERGFILPKDTEYIPWDMFHASDTAHEPGPLLSSEP